MEYIYNSVNVREGILITMDEKDKRISTKLFDDTIEYGYYYLPREVCKNIIISAGISGVHTSQAVKKMKSRINRKKGAIGEIIPGLRSISQDVISYYSGELAESIVNAAGKGKGVEIAIGYPKILVISVN